MTNAYVESTVAGRDGETVMVKYKGGEKKIVVGPDTVIAAVAPGNKSELKAGAHIIIFASENQADGSLLACWPQCDAGNVGAFLRGFPCGTAAAHGGHDRASVHNSTGGPTADFRPRTGT